MTALKKIKDFRYILLNLLFIDLIFVILHIFNKLHLFGDRFNLPVSFHAFESRIFSLTEDRGLAESFMYLKELTIVLLLIMLIYQNRVFLFGGLIFLFGYFLFDDMLSIHETVGYNLSEMFSFPSILGLRPEDLGELLVTAIAGAIIGSTLLIGYIIAKKEQRRIFRIYGYLIAGFLVFAVGVDMIDPSIDSLAMRGVVSMIEDTGEMFVMSLMVVYTLRFTVHCECEVPKFQLRRRTRWLIGSVLEWFWSILTLEKETSAAN